MASPYELSCDKFRSNFFLLILEHFSSLLGSVHSIEECNKIDLELLTDCDDISTNQTGQRKEIAIKLDPNDEKSYECIGNRVDGQKFECKICDKVVKSSASLKKHKNNHEKQRNYVCHQCDAFFLDNSGLKRHYKKHSDERPFKCDTCKSCFSFKFNLKRHKQCCPKKNRSKSINQFNSSLNESFTKG